MPFKGDMRLGGPHDNGARLNGSSEGGPSVPPAGTIIGTADNVTYVLGPVAEYTLPSSVYPYSVYTQKCSVPIVADGIGGQSYDYSNAFNIEYYPSGTMIALDAYTTPTYLQTDWGSFENGSASVSLVHDGYGSITTETGSVSYTYYGMEFYQDTISYDAYFPDSDQSYSVGSFARHYVHDQSGGYTYWDDAPSLVGTGTVVGTQEGLGYLTINGTDYPSTTYSSEIVWDGTSLQWGGGYTSYYPQNNLITESDGIYYYHDGNGGYFTYEGGPMPTGNYNSGTNYIDINGAQYANGTYTDSEYYWYNGTTWSTSYSYEPYGYTFTSHDNNDEWGNWMSTTYYKSDEAGGYFTETSS